MRIGDRSTHGKCWYLKLGLALLMTVGIVAGCSGGSDNKSAGPGVVLNQKQVEEALLTVADLPTGFSQSAPTQASNAVVTPTGCAELDAIGQTSTDPGATAKGEVELKRSDFGPFIHQSISVQPGRAKDLFDRASRALQVCPKFMTTQGDGTPTEVTLAPLAFPKLGDDTFAARLSFQTGFAPLSVDLAVVRLGDTFVTNTYFALGNTDPQILEQAARKSVEKVKASA